MSSIPEAPKPTLLIIDDSRTVRVSLAIMLRSRFTIIEAEDGEQGWLKLQENPSIRLIITDIQMPNLDGYGFICRVRGAESAAVKKLPIVVITSQEDDLSRERAHACGANNFIVKPVESSDLLETVLFHTEASLKEGGHVPHDFEKYGRNIENAVLEAPNIEKALEILRSANNGELKPYAVELAIKVLPLLEYCNKAFQMDVSTELQRLKSKLKAG